MLTNETINIFIEFIIEMYSKNLKCLIFKKLQNNGSIYLHSYAVAHGKSPDPSAGKGVYSRKWTVYKRKQLNK